MPECVVVIPCYNEAVRLPVDAFEAFVTRGHPVRFLMVNDGSTDDTQSVLESLHRRNPQRFDVLRLPQNGGKAEAVRRGMARRPAWRPGRGTQALRASGPDWLSV